MKKKFEITIKFTMDKDTFAGFGHTPESWIGFITRDFKAQDHYNTSFEVTEIKEKQKI